MSTEKAQKILNQYLSKKGLKHTHQRKIIFETFLESEKHLSIEGLLEKVRLLDPNIGYATVYRTLLLLQDCGLATARNFGEGQTLFERAGKHHDHLICLTCGKIIEFENQKIEALQEEVTQNFKFKMKSHRHELYGYCETCQKE